MHNPAIRHIANVWPSRAGGTCRRRRRPLDLLLSWAQEAGFALDAVRGDSGGVYSVVTLRLARGDEGAASGEAAARAGRPQHP